MSQNTDRKVFSSGNEPIFIGSLRLKKQSIARNPIQFQLQNDFVSLSPPGLIFKQGSGDRIMRKANNEDLIVLISPSDFYDFGTILQLFVRATKWYQNHEHPIYINKVGGIKTIGSSSFALLIIRYRRSLKHRSFLFSEISKCLQNLVAETVDHRY